MGWKISLIIIKGKYNKNFDELTKDIGLGESISTREIELREALYNDSFTIGFNNACTIITHQAFLMDFFNKKPSKMELKFSEVFSSEEMMVLGEHENAGIYGFSYIKGGKRIRIRLEGEEEGEIINIGKPFEIEKGHDIYELSIQLPKLFLGKTLDEDELLNTKMSVLKLKNAT